MHISLLYNPSALSALRPPAPFVPPSPPPLRAVPVLGGSRGPSGRPTTAPCTGRAIVACMPPSACHSASRCACHRAVPYHPQPRSRAAVRTAGAHPVPIHAARRAACCVRHDVRRASPSSRAAPRRACPEGRSPSASRAGQTVDRYHLATHSVNASPLPPAQSLGPCPSAGDPAAASRDLAGRRVTADQAPARARRGADGPAEAERVGRLVQRRAPLPGAQHSARPCLTCSARSTRGMRHAARAETRRARRLWRKRTTCTCRAACTSPAL